MIFSIFRVKKHIPNLKSSEIQYWVLIPHPWGHSLLKLLFPDIIYSSISKKIPKLLAIKNVTESTMIRPTFFNEGKDGEIIKIQKHKEYRGTNFLALIIFEDV